MRYNKQNLFKAFLKKYIVLLFFIINLILTLFLCIDSIIILGSFIIILGILTLILNELSFSKDLKPTISIFFVFFYCYMFLTPMFQVNYGKFPNTLLVDEKLVTLNNFYIIIFMSVYCLIYKYSKVKKSRILNVNQFIDNKTINLFAIICLLILIIFSKSIYTQITNPSSLMVFSEGGVSELFIKRFLFMVPLGYIFCVISSYNQIKNKKIHVFLSIMFVIFFLNPLMHKRNALGPIIIALIFYFPIKKIGNIGFTLFNVFILLFLFPSVKIFTHDYYIYSIPMILENIKNFSLYKEFIWLDYDAYSNSIATILYTKDYGFTLGKQLLSSILFFVPRSIWPNKAVTTGILIGGYLMDHYAMWFDNLSNPIISEAYIDFGIIGILIYSTVFAIISKKIDLGTNNNFGLIIALYMSSHMIFLMRGALMVGIAYLIGPLFAILLPIYISRIIYKKNNKT